MPKRKRATRETSAHFQRAASTTIPRSNKQNKAKNLPSRTKKASSKNANAEASFHLAFSSINRGLRLLEYSTAEIRKICAIGPSAGVRPGAKCTTILGKRTKSKTGKLRGPTASPHFKGGHALLNRPSSITNSYGVVSRVKKQTLKKSEHFVIDPFHKTPTPEGLSFDLLEPEFGLIQERIRKSLFALVIQTILWNQTTGRAARPILFTLLSRYPTPESLANAESTDVLAIIQTLGLQKVRSARLIKMAQAWVAAPPDPTRRYNRRNYPRPGDHLGLKDGYLLGEGDEREGWEIAHLPGVGPYALDSFRIFYRDTLRGKGEDGDEEPEWNRVVPGDKDLRAYLIWKWEKEGWKYDPLTGKRTPLKEIEK